MYFNTEQQIRLKKFIKHHILEAIKQNKKDVEVDCQDFIKSQVQSKREYKIKLNTNYSDKQIFKEIDKFNDFLLEENLK